MEQNDSHMDDPHASKIDPNDPRLSIEKPKGRKLKKKPVIAVVGAIALVIALSFAAALMPPSQQVEPPKVEEATTAAFAMPDVIREAPATYADVPEPEPIPAPVVPALGEPLPGDLGAAMVPRAQTSAPALPGGPIQKSPEEIERERLLEKAKSANPFFQTGGPALAQPNMDSYTTERMRELEQQIAQAQGAGDTGSLFGASSDGGGMGGGDQNRQGEKRRFLSTSERPADAYLKGGLASPVSPYEVKAGTIIPTVLITGINSDLPGPVTAQVRENVFDTVSGNHLLIPQGSRAIGTYDSSIAYGQERVLVVWSRIILPNGDSINLEGMQGVDLSGFAGYSDEVNHHWGRLIGGVVLSSLLSIGAQNSQGDVTGYQASNAQQMADNLGENINQVGQQFVDKNLKLQPTITVRPGFAVNIMVNKDMILRPVLGE